MTETVTLISVLIRTKNREIALRRAIGSVRNQTHHPIEVIVVNDGDSFEEPVENHGFAKFVVHATKAGGRSDAANIALDNATGKYCLFLDDDDEIAPNHLKWLAGALDNNPNIIAAYSKTKCIEAADYDNPIKIYDTPFDQNQLILENFLPIHAVLFRRDAATHIRFSPQLDIYEDWHFWLQLSSVGEFEQIDIMTSIYHLDYSGIGAQATKSYVEERKKFLKLAIPLLSADQLLFLQYRAMSLFGEQQISHELRLETDALKRENSSLLKRLNDVGLAGRFVSNLCRVFRGLIRRKR